LNDDTLNSQPITLDADLHSGSGLRDTSEIDLAPDFGFSETGATITQVDVEIAEQASWEEEPEATDIIPPTAQKIETILESEIMPSDDDPTEEYDLSMSVDATKHIVEDDAATAKDLMAVAVHTDDGIDHDTGEYTLNEKIDFQILEQDYEDELTSTQVLNKEIEEAARALVEEMDDLGVSGGKTDEMPSVKDPEISAELTAKLPASGDAKNEEFDDSSVILPVLTAETAEMPLAESDGTLEMESGSIDTKKSKAS